MKSISKFISLALLIAAATACNTKEIDKPDIPDQPQISGNVKFTASMKQTRVEYSVNGDALHQCWEVDDVIYGFYGDNPVSKVTLKVTEVDEDTEYATLEATVAEEGADFIAAIKNAGEEHILVGLLYTGRNDNAVKNKTVTVNMHDQSSGNIPACMTSNSYEITKDSESGDTLIQFVFANECAILEIQSLTGIKNKLSEDQTIDLASIEVAGVLPYCEYTYDGDSFSSKQSNEYYTSVIVKPTTERPLKADSKGNIIDTDGKRSCIRIAVGASSVSSEITVTATQDDDSSTQYSSNYKGTFRPGCYIICAKDVVAKTEDGFYFTSVSGAFDHASTLVRTFGDNNTVTLVKDYINGLNEDVAHEVGDYDPTYYEPTIIDIDYPVKLDLNGCTLSLDCNDTSCEWDSFYSGGFNVLSGGTLTIDDSEGYGCVDSGSYDCPIITNSGTGTVNILGGSLSHWESCQVINSTGTVNVSGGDLYAYASPAITLSDPGAIGNILGGVIGNNNSSTSYLATVYIQNGAECNISGGTIYSKKNSSTIVCQSAEDQISKLTIKWPTSPIQTMTNQQYGEYIKQPLIYCKSSDHYSNSPITAYYAKIDGIPYDNTAQVLIQGGYLFTHATYGYFYNDDDINQDKFDNLQFSSCGHFYANTYMINMKGDTNKDVDLQLYTYGNKTIKGEDKSSECFTPEFLDDVFDDYQEETSLWYFE